MNWFNETFQLTSGPMFWVIFCILCFVQNMIFTAVNRSRQSANYSMHMFWATLSNGVWFLVSWIFLFPKIFQAVMEGDWQIKLLFGAVYTLCTTLGSVTMMWLMNKYVKGKGKVGATDYKFQADDVVTIYMLTNRNYGTDEIKKLLIKHNGVYQDTLRELISGK